MQDRKYINAFQAWDYSGFESLYEKYIDVIFAFILRKTSDTQVAEDICSQVWIKALKSLEFFGDKENANFKAWIYCIAQNTVIDYYRTKKEKIDIESIAEPGISNDFAQHIDQKAKLQEVITYMDSLKSLEREIVTMRIWDDLSYKHIAKVLDKKEDACKKTFSRAIKKIQANIKLAIFILFFM